MLAEPHRGPQEGRERKTPSEATPIRGRPALAHDVPTERAIMACAAT
jgi:hypothetical protein